MGVENAVHRAKELGKLPKAKKRHGKLRQRLSEKDSIEEQQKEKMIKVLEDILVNKKSSDSDVSEKEPKVSNIVKMNLKTLKKQAEKEGLSISELIKMLKSE